jgi:hypothetical protein
MCCSRAICRCSAALAGDGALERKHGIDAAHSLDSKGGDYRRALIALLELDSPSASSKKWRRACGQHKARFSGSGCRSGRNKPL